MSKPTKILLYDLAEDIQSLLESLKEVQGNYPSIHERLMNIDVSMLNKEEKAVIQDLIDAYNNDNKGHVRERLEKIENQLSAFTLESLEQGDYNEAFTYDESGNVILHEVTGDREYKVNYAYKTDGSGELDYSIKEFRNNKGQIVKIHQSYTYTNGDITGIATATTVDDIAPADVSNLAAASNAPGTVDFSWVNPTDEDFSSISLYVNDNKNPTVTGIVGESYQLTGVLSGDYTFTMKAVDTSNNESIGITTEITTVE